MFAEENRQQTLAGTTEMAFPGVPEQPFQWFPLMFAEENRQQTSAGTTEMGRRASFGEEASEENKKPFQTI